MIAHDITAPFTVAELVEASRGREGTMRRVLLDAAAQIEEVIRARILADAEALGVDPGNLLAKLTCAALEPAKRMRATTARPEAPAEDAALSALDAGRSTAKGLAGKFRGADIDRVRRVLADEASAGAKARVKLEPNGRTWVRVTP